MNQILNITIFATNNNIPHNNLDQPFCSSTGFSGNIKFHLVNHGAGSCFDKNVTNNEFNQAITNIVTINPNIAIVEAYHVTVSITPLIKNIYIAKIATDDNQNTVTSNAKFFNLSGSFL
jgi:hypothetical protein